MYPEAPGTAGTENDTSPYVSQMFKSGLRLVVISPGWPGTVEVNSTDILVSPLLPHPFSAETATSPPLEDGLAVTELVPPPEIRFHPDRNLQLYFEAPSTGVIE